MMLMKVRQLPTTDAASDMPGRGIDLLVVAGSAGSSHHFESEERLYARGATGGCAWVVVSGLVRFERVTVAGSRRILRVAGVGDLIGQEALLRQPYRDDAVACTPVSLRRMSASLLDESTMGGGALPFLLLNHWQDTLDQSESWSTEVALGSSRRRVLQLLARLHLHRDDDDLIWLPTREQMGDMLDMAIETCSRVISPLRKEGILVTLPPRHATLDSIRLAEALKQSED